MPPVSQAPACSHGYTVHRGKHPTGQPCTDTTTTSNPPAAAGWRPASPADLTHDMNESRSAFRTALVSLGIKPADATHAADLFAAVVPKTLARLAPEELTAATARAEKAERERDQARAELARLYADGRVLEMSWPSLRHRHMSKQPQARPGSATHCAHEPADDAALGEPAGYEITARRLHHGPSGLTTGVVVASAVSTRPTLAEAVDELRRIVGPAEQVEGCDCESYVCTGQCCGVGNCSCTPGFTEAVAARRAEQAED
ncbi:hypothetical protein ABZ671_00665 [Micromonospora sp. NPDC006766]|uniref:hypothetical protein n=1 Tax=Micromonospora sp. NPDC006766 TaxID=3154778 RepID=UPI0033EA8ACA